MDYTHLPFAACSAAQLLKSLRYSSPTASVAFAVILVTTVTFEVVEVTLCGIDGNSTGYITFTTKFVTPKR